MQVYNLKSFILTFIHFTLFNFSCQNASEGHVSLIIIVDVKNKPIIKALGVFPTSTNFQFNLLTDRNIMFFVFFLFLPPVRPSI